MPPQLGPHAGPKLQYQASDLLDEWDDGPRIRAKVKDVPRDVKGVLVPVLDEFGNPDMMAMEFGRRVRYYYLQSPAGYGHVILNGEEEVLYVMPTYLKDMEILGSDDRAPPARGVGRASAGACISSADPLRGLGHLSTTSSARFRTGRRATATSSSDGGEHPDVYNAYYAMAEEANKLRDARSTSSRPKRRADGLAARRSGEKIAQTPEGYELAAEESCARWSFPADFLKRLLRHPTLSDYEQQRSRSTSTTSPVTCSSRTSTASPSARFRG